MNKEIFCFIFSSVILLFSGCASREVSQVAAGEPVLIQTKAQIKNGDDSNTVNIDIALLPGKAVRLEITGSFGVSVATVLLTPSEIVYALHSTKQFAVGPFNEKTLYPIFKKKIDPRIFWRIINSQSMMNLNLQCEVDSQRRPLKCTASDGAHIRWFYDQHPRKRIDIISNRFEMNWIFREQKALGEYQNETFVLKKPENYQEIIIK